jgi:hypothetical protein
MTSTIRNHDHSIPIETAVKEYLRDKGKGEAGESGNYRSDAERELNRFVTWLHEEDLYREPTFADLDERTFRRYARNLVGLGNVRGTTLTYYAYISSFWDWAVDEGHLARHYAQTSLARAPLPEDDGRRPGDQQAWEPEHRDLITRYVDEQAAVAINALEDREGTYEAVKICRDRALVYLLCYPSAAIVALSRYLNSDGMEATIADDGQSVRVTTADASYRVSLDRAEGDGPHRFQLEEAVEKVRAAT